MHIKREEFNHFFLIMNNIFKTLLVVTTVLLTWGNNDPMLFGIINKNNICFILFYIILPSIIFTQSFIFYFRPVEADSNNIKKAIKFLILGILWFIALNVFPTYMRDYLGRK